MRMCLYFAKSVSDWLMQWAFYYGIRWRPGGKAATHVVKEEEEVVEAGLAGRLSEGGNNLCKEDCGGEMIRYVNQS